jgi:hypothetical protein
VQHIVSGKACSFTDWDTLHTFILAVLSGSVAHDNHE